MGIVPANPFPVDSGIEDSPWRRARQGAR